MIHALCSPLHGVLRHRRVLVVEDEALVAMTVEDELLEAGADVVGPHADLRDALRWVEALGPGGIDLAVLDANLGGVSSQPLAAALADRGIPFVLATGYGADAVEEGYRDPP